MHVLRAMRRRQRRGWPKMTGRSRTTRAKYQLLTLEPGQQGLDLRELKNKGCIEYLDRKKNKYEGPRFEYPHEGGTW
ncbi:hypothetical protein V1524DRAFT_443129 [Lipomyces starkeyi]